MNNNEKIENNNNRSENSVTTKRLVIDAFKGSRYEEVLNIYVR